MKPFPSRLLSIFLVIMLDAVSVAAPFVPINSFASNDDACLSDAAWRSGFVYSVYDPLYGRSLPEVKRNQNGRGHPLSIRGKQYDKGFGCYRYTVIEFDVPPGARALSAIIGIDDERTGPGGDTYFSVWVDGSCIWVSPSVSREDPPVLVTVPLRGAKHVKLVTDAQGYGNNDLADWCDIRWFYDLSSVKVGSEDQPSWSYLAGIGTWYVKPELHPLHLHYKGEDLHASVISGSEAGSGQAEIEYVISDAEGAPAAGGHADCVLIRRADRQAQADVRIPAANLKNGLYVARLLVRYEGKVVAERQTRFGIIERQLASPPAGSIFGVNHHEFVASYEALAAAGIEWSRQWFCWAWIEPRKGEYNWSWHDERMAAAKYFGIKTIGVLGGLGEPAWSSPQHVGQSGRISQGFPDDLSAWEDYVRQVATRYRGQVKVWESWNEIGRLAEAEIDGWSVAKYVQLHRRTYSVLKEIDPDNQVLLSGGSEAFLLRCLSEGLGDAFDGLVIHPYRMEASPEAEINEDFFASRKGDVLAVFRDLSAWLQEHGKPQTSIWATEIGWPVSGEVYSVSEETQSRYLQRTSLLALASGKAANLCWHDFAHEMAGICDDQGFPRPAIIGFAGFNSRLRGSQFFDHEKLRGGVHACRFRRDNSEILALWSESDMRFATVKPASSDQQATLFDHYGNPLPLHIPGYGCTIPVTGRVTYLETSASLTLDVDVSRSSPIKVSPESVEIIAGREAKTDLTIDNVFGESGEFAISARVPENLKITIPEIRLNIRHGKKATLPVRVISDSTSLPEESLIPLTVVTSNGLEVSLPLRLRILPQVRVDVEPAHFGKMGCESADIQVVLANRGGRDVTGKLTVHHTEGLSVWPLETDAGVIVPGAAHAFPLHLSCRKASDPALDDSLTVQLVTANGVIASKTARLTPTVLDADYDGVADGWQVSPRSLQAALDGTVLESSIEPGHAELFCQKIHCSRFNGKWVIFSRDGTDRIVKGRRYQISFWARQLEMDVSLAVAVINIKPWEHCFPITHFRVSPEWKKFTKEFTAERDSENSRFEFFFSGSGTLWIEGMALQEVR